jgi:hypothetical protein
MLHKSRYFRVRQFDVRVRVRTFDPLAEKVFSSSGDCAVTQHQGDQIGRIFAYWAVVYFGQLRKFLGYFFPRYKLHMYVLCLKRKWVGQNSNSSGHPAQHFYNISHSIQNISFLKDHIHIHIPLKLCILCTYLGFKGLFKQTLISPHKPSQWWVSHTDWYTHICQQN